MVSPEQHGAFEPQNESNRDDAEWQLPASEARKRAVGNLIDAHVRTPSDEYDEGYFALNPELLVRFTRYSAGDGSEGPRTIELLNTMEASTPRLHKVLHQPITVDGRGVAEQLDLRHGVQYTLWTDDVESDFHKTEWPGKADDEEGEVVSEGEAHWLLSNLSNVYPYPEGNPTK